MRMYPVEAVDQLEGPQLGDYLFLLGKLYIYDMAPKQTLPPGPNDSSSTWPTENARYLLGYFYLKTAAEKYSQPDAYYYLSVLEYMKLTPALLIRTNIRKTLKNLSSRNPTDSRMLKQWEEEFNFDSRSPRSQKFAQTLETLEEVAYDMESHHLHNTEQNLYLASVLGHTPARLTLAYLLRHGINVEKNCSSALAYYLSTVKSSKVDVF